MRRNVYLSEENEQVAADAISFNLLDVAAYNAFLLMKRNGYLKDRSSFIRALTMQLATPNMLRRMELQRVPANSKSCIRTALNITPAVLTCTLSAQTRNPGHCHICRRSSRCRCSSCNQFCCKQHGRTEKMTQCNECL